MRFALKKLLTFLLTILFVTLLVFVAFELIPGDAATAKLGTNATPEALSRLREELGLNRPLIVRYFTWVVSFFFGDMGRSTSYGMSVKSMLSSKLPITLTLTVMAFIFVVVIAFPIGLYSSKKDGSIVAKCIDAMTQITMSVPSFFLGILITYFFGIVLRLFVPGGFVNYTADMGKFLSYLIFPALAIALPKAAMCAKYLKTAILDESRLDYIRTAYSRGNSTMQVLYKHVLKNALISVITFLGMTLSDMVAGSLVVEQVFSIPGFGRLLISSIANRDYAVTQSIIAIIAIIVVSINLIVDLLYMVIDPRIRGN